MPSHQIGNNPAAVHLIVLVALAFATSACGEASDGGGTVDKSVSCATMCAKLELCDSSGVDESDCTEACEDDRVVAQVGQRAVTDCVDELSCNQLSFDLIDCVDDAFSIIDPTEAGRDFCSEWAETANVCDENLDRNDARRDCEDWAGGKSDVYVEALQECLVEPCDRIVDCMFEVDDRFDTSGSGQTLSIVRGATEVILVEFEPEPGPSPSPEPCSGPGCEEPAPAACCSDTNPCGWEEDGWCDCDAAFAWDAVDCFGGA